MRPKTASDFATMKITVDAKAFEESLKAIDKAFLDSLGRSVAKAFESAAVTAAQAGTAFAAFGRAVGEIPLHPNCRCDVPTSDLRFDEWSEIETGEVVVRKAPRRRALPRPSVRRAISFAGVPCD